MTGRIRIPEIPPHVFPELAGKTSAVVGGGGGGVGTAAVALLVQSGAKVLVVDRAAERLDQLIDHFGPSVTGVVADITTAAGMHEFDRVIAETDLKSLVNVVGGVMPGEVAHFLELDAQQWQRSLDLDFTYAVRTCQIAARRMAATKTQGALVNLSVADARHAMPWFAAYGAARSALEAATRTMAVELGALGIRANSVAWGLVDTPRAHSGQDSDGSLERALIPLGRRGNVAEVATAVVFLLTDLSSYITGHTLVVDGGLSLRGPQYGAGHNIPEFLESGSARNRLLEAVERVGRTATGRGDDD
ncbi:SDR family NAD(P)-dependent oxidoreductase [Amycolatopsis circi]|uniref:SDR family NAD(P)-dependent oxidoreductase n=1 Tax=Amycolatopsis circi TaxID=871959 RepID=UPI0013BE93A7|nr:SDR family oxidoreductase [Amycolatopsis circi]